MSRALRVALLAALIAPAACGNKGTFVIVDLPSGPADKVVSIHAKITLAGKTAETDFSPKSGAFAFPTSASLEVGSGAGTLSVTATALNAAGVAIATAMGSVEVVRDTTVHLSLPFENVQPMDGSMQTGDIAIAPNGFDFGTVLIGAMSAPKRFQVTNTGTQTTGPLMALLNGMDAMDYVLMDSTDAKCLGLALPPNAGCAFEVRFAPKTAGLVKNAIVRVLAPDGTPGGNASAALLGSAGEKGDLMMSAGSPSFPPTLLTATSAEITYTVTNSGNVSSTAIAISISGNDATSFIRGADGCNGQALAAKATCTVKVAFKPTARGMLAATLVATATKGGTATADLTGTGQIPALLTITGAAPMVTPANLGTVDVNATGTIKHLVTVKNDGDFVTGALSIDTIPVSSPDITPTGATTCATGMTLNPGASCIGELVLTPKTFGAKNLQVNFAASPGGTVSTFVTGVGHDQVFVNVINASTDGSTGVIGDTAVPNNFNCTGNPGTGMCTKTFDRTTSSISMTILATPNAATYSNFSSWNSPSGSVCSGTTTSGQCSYTMDASVAPNTAGTPYTFKANYVKKKFNLTYTRKDFGGGVLGTLTSTGGGGISCTGPCTNGAVIQIDGGTMITIIAAQPNAAGAPAAVRKISGACAGRSANLNSATCTFTMDADKDVQVLYSQYNFAFVSSQQFDGNLGGLGTNNPPAAATGAALKCQQLADNANLPGVFVAMLSDAVQDATQMIPAGTGGWIRPDGKPFAQNKSVLFGSAAPAYGVFYPLRMDETGALHSNDLVRTYTNANGSHKSSGDNCTSWTVNTGGTSQYYGSSSAGSIGWTDLGGIGFTCASQMRLYCMGISQTADVPGPSTPPGTVKRVFLSTGTFTPGVGKSLSADMDGLCKTEGQATFGSGTTWKALASNTTTTMAQQGGAGPFVYMRPDKVAIGDTNQVFGASPSPQAPIDVYKDNSYIQPATQPWVWTGVASPTAFATSVGACMDWTGSAAGGLAGNALESNSSFYVANGSSFGCTNAFKLYCIEQ